MSTLLVWREQIQVFYAKYSSYIIKGLRFILGLVVFWLINTNVGFMKAASSIICTVGLSVVCAFFPLTIMVLAATALILIHFYSLSIAIAIVSALIFILMYIFYFRFVPGKAWLVLLTAVSYALKVPLVIPVAIGLLGTPVCLIPAVCGTISYYMIHLVKTSSSAFKGEGAAGLINALIAFTKQVLINKEMWIMSAAVVLCILLVYGIRTRSVDHSWKIASVVGAVCAIVVCAVGNVMLEQHISYVILAVSGVLAIVAGLLLEMLFLSVDYTRTEQLEFEDDEYHYYVKAVPKLAVTVPEKNVKHITERQETGQFDSDAVKKSAGISEKKKNKALSEGERMEKGQNADDILLTRSLNKELGLDRSEKE